MQFVNAHCLLGVMRTSEKAADAQYCAEELTSEK